MRELKRVKTEKDPDTYAEPVSVVEKGQITGLEEKLNTIIEREGTFFCSQPFIHMYVPIYGFAHPCCNTTMNVKNHISQIGIDGVWNEPELSLLRKEFAEEHSDSRDRTLKTCYRCIETNYLGYSSPRTAYNKDMEKDPESLVELDRLVQFVKENPDAHYPVPNIIHTSQIKVFGNYCNLRCLMCSAEDSSGVAEEWIALEEYTPEEIAQRSIDRSGSEVPFTFPSINYQDNNINEEEYWETIKRSIRVMLIGGETWLIKQYVDVLERMVEEGLAPDKRLFIFSNNSKIPNIDKICNWLSKFKSVHYKCSMELWGKQNEYIRYPSKWKMVINNIKKIGSLPNVNLGFAFTINPLNAGYVDNAILGVEEDMKGFRYNSPSFFNVTRPHWFTMKSLPDDIVDHHLSKLYSNESWVIEKSKKIIEYLEKREFNEEKYHTMIERITARDKLRGDNVLNYFPEWKPHFKDSYYG